MSENTPFKPPIEEVIGTSKGLVEAARQVVANWGNAGELSGVVRSLDQWVQEMQECITAHELEGKINAAVRKHWQYLEDQDLPELRVAELDYISDGPGYAGKMYLVVAGEPQFHMVLVEEGDVLVRQHIDEGDWMVTLP